MRPKCSRSGNTSSCKGRKAPPESTDTFTQPLHERETGHNISMWSHIPRYTHGKRFWPAISCARRCFFTVMGKYVPPLTVASLATIMHSWLLAKQRETCGERHAGQGGGTNPWMRPMPVTTPPDGTGESYISQAASGDNSRNGEPSSSRALMRSRGSILPRSRCFLMAFSPPPWRTSSWRSRSSAMSLSISSRLALNSGDVVDTFASRTGMSASTPNARWWWPHNNTHTHNPRHTSHCHEASRHQHGTRGRLVMQRT